MLLSIPLRVVVPKSSFEYLSESTSANEADDLVLVIKVTLRSKANCLTVRDGN